MIRWNGYYLSTGGLFANRELVFSLQDVIRVNELDKEFCFIKPKDFFFTRLSNLYESFYKSFLLLQTSCAALSIPGMR